MKKYLMRAQGSYFLFFGTFLKILRNLIPYEPTAAHPKLNNGTGDVQAIAQKNNNVISSIFFLLNMISPSFLFLLLLPVEEIYKGKCQYSTQLEC